MRAFAGLMVVLALAMGLGGCAGQRSSSSTTAPVGQPSSGTAPVSSSPTPQPSVAVSLPPMPGPGEWAPEITNPWFPFVPGTTFVFRGQKDAQPTVDTYIVTNRKKTIQGAPATVIINTLRTGSHEIEGTEDWYAQDKQGNVWYLGEATRTFDKNGKVTGTTGSWQAGVDGAQGGLFMPASPKVGDAYYQEYLKGQAEDQYKIISMDGTVTVPYGTYKNVLVTEETTALEPSIVSQKYYVKGVGQVYEVDVKGSTEYAKLIRIVKK
jgi:hypothetical protein